MSEFTVTIKNQTLHFQTDENVFSPGGLDRGTAAMLSVVEFLPGDKVLDLGCGYGAVGILAAKLIPPGQVTLCDLSENAVRLSLQNAARNGIAPANAKQTLNALRILQSDGFCAISDRDYTKILSNPPYHTDFSVAKGFIEDGFSHLAVGGVMYMVTKRREWYKNKLISVFGGVHIDEIDGYYVFTAEKRARVRTAGAGAEKMPEGFRAKKAEKPQKLSKKLAKKEMRKRRK